MENAHDAPRGIAQLSRIKSKVLLLFTLVLVPKEILQALREL